jgi:hypothetical protein
MLDDVRNADAGKPLQKMSGPRKAVGVVDVPARSSSGLER